MPKKLGLCAVAALIVLTTAPAQAGVVTASTLAGGAGSTAPGDDPVFLFTFTAAGVSGSASLSATDNLNGTYTATGGTGAFNGVPVSVLTDAAYPALSPLGLFIYDDLLYPGSNPVIDGFGLLFSVPSGISPFSGNPGTTEINLWGNGDGSYQYYEGGPQGPGYATTSFSEISLSLADPVSDPVSVPEPDVAMLLGGALLGLAALLTPSRRSDAAPEPVRL